VSITINSILMTIVLSVFIFFALADKGGTYFVGAEMEVYLLMIVVMCSLAINAQFKNEFLEFLNTFFVLFYVLRIPFIFSDTVASDVLARDVDISDVPWYLFILTVQYLYFVISILVVNPKISRMVVRDMVSKTVFKNILFFCYLVILANLLKSALYFDIYGSTLHFIPAILGAIFTERNALMVVVILIFVSGKHLVSKYKYSIAGIIMLVFIEGIYAGSKSITLEFFLLLYLGLLVVYGPLKLKIRSLLVTFVGGVTGVILYFFGIATRGLHVGRYEFSIDNLILLLNTRFDYNIEYFLNGFSYRIGYLDFFIQKISTPIYEPYVNLLYYSKSIIDNITPGFDVFGVPYSAGAIFSAYFGESDVANSEFITVFGEAYIIFGFFSFFFYITMLMFVKYSILKFKSPYTVNTALFNLFILFNFYMWLRGPGLDLLVVYILYKVLFVISVMTIVRYSKINIKFSGSQSPGYNSRQKS
jgi:hypothetical protein